MPNKKLDKARLLKWLDKNSRRHYETDAGLLSVYTNDKCISRRRLKLAINKGDFDAKP